MDFFEKLKRLLLYSIFLVLISQVPGRLGAKSSQKNVISDIVDIKDFKKLLRTKNNVLTLFVNSPKQSGSVIKVFEETAELIRGQGTMLLTDCSGEAKKLCKKLKVSTEPYVIKHYKDGEFHKNYDRKYTVSSMLTFMRDPTGDIPWDEDSTTSGIVHLPDPSSLGKLLKREMGPVMVMFYAPWCGFCKQLKPEYAAAATELKGHSILAAIDVNKPENSAVRYKYNITGFPTLIYFESGVKKYTYEGENNKDGLVSFMKNPTLAPVKPIEVPWSATESEVLHLKDDTFDDMLKENENTLVMFYAPWCGHCKKLKPEYEKAAEKMKKGKVDGALAALDATKESKTAKRFSVTGYPTLKFFKSGEFQFDVNIREEKELVNFMKNPKKPPPPPPPEKPWAEEESEVTHLTTEEFKPFLRKKKYALVMFYAPWCGHCKKAKPEFTAAAESFKDNTRVAFAAVDCTSHQGVCSTYDVKGYPTIKLFHYLNKARVEDYTGGRTQDDFTKFMNKYSGSKPSDYESKPEKTAKPKVDEKKVESVKKTEKVAKDEKRVKVDKVEDKPLPGDDWKEYENSDLVLHLTDSNFHSSLRDHDYLLVFYYNSGCRDCSKIQREYSQAALMVENRKLSGKLAAFNASAYKAKLEAVDDDFPTSLPAFKFYRKGVPKETYTGKHNAAAFFNYFKQLQSKKKDEL